MTAPPKPPFQDAQAYMRYAGLAMQMGLTIGLFTWGGLALDNYLGIDKAFVVAGALLGVGLALYQVIRQTLPPKS